MDTTVAGLEVRVTGAGEPLLLVPGSGSGPDSWETVVDELPEGFEAWSFVRRGYGPGPAPTTFAAEVGDLRALLAAIGRPAHVVGGSVGATLALHIAASDPRGIRSLALFEPPLLLPSEHLPALRERFLALTAAGAHRDAGVLLAREVMHMPEALVAAIAEGPEPDPEEARRESRGWAGDLAQLAAEPTDVERWSGVTLPVLLLQGGETWSPIPEGVDALARALPHAERVAWPGHSHFASMTAPDLFASAVTDFARRHCGDGRVGA